MFFAPSGLNNPDITEGSIEYVYDATGVKLSKTVNSSGPTTNGTPTTTYYAGNYMYEETPSGEALKFFNHPEGYVEPETLGFSTPSNPIFNYIYQYKDHLGNIRLSYNKGSYQSLIESAFYEEYDGWIYNGGSANGNIELESGRLKVNVLNPYNGASIIIGDSFVTGAQVDISIEVDKAGTDKIYAVLQELDTNNNVIAIYNMNSNLHTGSYNFSHTVVSGEKLRLKIAKSNTDVGNPTHFYIDNVYASTGEPEIVEENNYYPFGLKHKGYNNVVNGVDHPYGFGGKEEQNELGLGWLDVTARNYDPALGRWMNLDPLAEDMRRHSPYNYAFDNPIYFMDYDGMEPSDRWKRGQDGTLTWVNNDGGDTTDYVDNVDAGGNVTSTDVYDVVDNTTSSETSEMDFVFKEPGSRTGAKGKGRGIKEAEIDDGVAIVVEFIGEEIGVSPVIMGVVAAVISGDPKKATKKINPKKAAREAGKKKRAQQPASEKRAKDYGKDLEKREGKDARRKAHDAKDGKKDRTVEQLKEDYKIDNG